MATDATGTPSTIYSIPKYNTSADAPSGLGLNAIVDFLDTLLAASGTNLGATARVGIRKNSAGSVFARRRLNLIEGAGITLTVADDAANEEVDITIAGSSSSPSGVIAAFGGTAAPTDWLLCDGTSYATATYPALHTAIGYTYGGAGANFNVPDLRGRIPVGKGTHADVDTLGENDGAALADRRPAHKHTVVNPGVPSGTGQATGTRAATTTLTDLGNIATTGGTVGPQDAGTPTDEPSYIVLNYIIKT